jgi:hypothetical protein
MKEGITILDADRHRELISDSTAWLATGKRLLASADLVWAPAAKALEDFAELGRRAEAAGGFLDVDARSILTDMSHGAVFRLLAGYAIENLLKGVRVRRLRLNGERVTNDKGELVGLPLSHKYVEFARQEFKQSNLTLSIMEEQLLRRLSLAVRWAGRYPIDRNPPPSNDWLAGLGSVSTDRDDAHALAKRIIELHDSLR